MRRLAIGLVAAVVAIGHATAGESQAAAAAGSWSWGAASDDGALVAVPPTEARPARLGDAPPPARLAAAALPVAPSFSPPPEFRIFVAGRAYTVPAPVLASDRSARGPPTADAP